MYIYFKIRFAKLLFFKNYFTWHTRARAHHTTK